MCIRDRREVMEGAIQVVGGVVIVVEVDLDLTWNVRAVKGLQVRFRNAYWDNGGAQTGYQFRVILNYEFDLL